MDVVEGVSKASTNCSVLAIPHRSSKSILATDNISHLSASSNYTYIHYDGKTILASKTLAFFQKKLCPNNFIRTHQSYTINRNYIKSIDFKASMIILKNGYEIPIARSRKRLLKKELGN